MEEFVCVSVQALYNEYGEDLTYNEIEVSDSTTHGKYYDLYADSGLVCMDGEECEVIARTNNSILLANRNGEVDTHFELSSEEFERATF